MYLARALIGCSTRRAIVTLLDYIIALVELVGYQRYHTQTNYQSDTNQRKRHSVSMLNPTCFKSSQKLGYDLVTTCGLLIISPGCFSANGAKARAMR